SEVRPRVRDVSRPEGDGVGEGAVDRLQVLVAAVLEEHTQLRRALEWRIAIEQVQGQHAERFGLPMQGAGQMLRRARHYRRLTVSRAGGDLVVGRGPGEAAGAWWVHVLAVRKGDPLPAAAAGKTLASADMPIPTQIVRTSGLTYCIVS